MRTETMDMIMQMCVDKPTRYVAMVIEKVERADGYAKKAGGNIVSRQVIAWIMTYCDMHYTEVNNAEH